MHSSRVYGKSYPLRTMPLMRRLRLLNLTLSKLPKDPNFISLASEIFDEVQRTNPSSSSSRCDFITQLCRALNLPLVVQLAIGLGLAHSHDIDNQLEAVQFLKTKLGCALFRQHVGMVPCSRSSRRLAYFCSFTSYDKVALCSGGPWNFFAYCCLVFPIESSERVLRSCRSFVVISLRIKHQRSRAQTTCECRFFVFPANKTSIEDE